MQIVDIFCENGIREEITYMIALIESNSEHPVGKSISEQIKKQSNIHEFTDILVDFQALPGMGVTATVNRKHKIFKFVIGNMELMELHKCSITSYQKDQVSDGQANGHTVIIASMNGAVSCIISLADQIRPEARRVVNALDSMGITSCMVTGDVLKTANIIAAQCNITEVYASVSPAGKQNIITQLQKKGIAVCMVGDGINDSASLAQSDLGIAVFGGTDVAIEAASVVLMRPDLTDIVTAIDLARKIYSRIWLNFMWASIYNVLMIPLAMGVGAPWGIYFLNKG